MKNGRIIRVGLGGDAAPGLISATRLRLGALALTRIISSKTLWDIPSETAHTHREPRRFSAIGRFPLGRTDFDGPLFCRRPSQKPFRRLRSSAGPSEIPMRHAPGFTQCTHPTPQLILTLGQFSRIYSHADLKQHGGTW